MIQRDFTSLFHPLHVSFAQEGTHLETHSSGRSWPRTHVLGSQSFPDTHSVRWASLRSGKALPYKPNVTEVTTKAVRPC